MQKVKWMPLLVVWLTAASLLAQGGRQVVDTKEVALLDAQREKRALQALLRIAEKEIIPAVEVGPEAVRTKAEILDYLKGSFAQLYKATEAIGQTTPSVNASPISPLNRGEVTRSALIVESLIHAFDHYGQMVEYLRMNGVVPPASRP